MATHCSFLAWKIPWIEEPDRLKFIGSQRVGYDLSTKQQLRLRYAPEPVFPKKIKDCHWQDNTAFSLNILCFRQIGANSGAGRSKQSSQPSRDTLGIAAQGPLAVLSGPSHFPKLPLPTCE